MPRAASPAPIEHSSLSPIPSIALVAAEPAPAAKDPAIEAAEKAAQEELVWTLIPPSIHHDSLLDILSHNQLMLMMIIY